MNRTELSAIWRHSRIYGVGNVVNRLAGLVLLPVYLHVLSPGEFGVLAIVTLTTDVLGVLLGLGLGRAFIRFHAAAQTDGERDRLLVTSLLLLLSLGAPFAILAFPIARLASELLFSGHEHTVVFAYANLSVVFTVLLNFELSCLMAKKASKAYFLASAYKSLLMLATNLFLVVYAGLGVKGVVLGTLLSSIVVGGILLLSLLRGRRLTGSVRTARKLIVFAAPLIPSVLLDTVAAALDKVAINHFAAPSAVGGYSSGQRLSSLLQLFVVQPFMQIWAVRRLEVLEHGTAQGRSSLAWVFDCFFVILCAAALFVSLFAPEIVALIAAAEYAPAAEVVPILALAELVLVYRSFFELNVYRANATRHLPWVSLVTVAVAVPVYVWLVSAYGIEGAALAFLAMAILRVGLVARLALRVLPSRTDLNVATCAITLGVSAGVFLAASALLADRGGAGVYLAKLTVVLAYSACMLLRPAIGGGARALARDWLQTRRTLRARRESSRSGRSGRA